MNGEDINKLILFALKYAGYDIYPYPIKEFYEYLRKLYDAGQVMIYCGNGDIDGFITYFRISEEDIAELIKIRNTWLTPKNYVQGDIVYIDTVAKNNKITLKELMQKLLKKEPNIKIFSWCSRNDQIKFSKRRYDNA
jgi:hypothetical protein